MLLTNAQFLGGNGWRLTGLDATIAPNRGTGASGLTLSRMRFEVVNARGPDYSDMVKGLLEQDGFQVERVLTENHADCHAQSANTNRTWRSIDDNNWRR